MNKGLSAKDFWEDPDLARRTLLTGLNESKCPSFITDFICILDLLHIPAGACWYIAYMLVKCSLANAEIPTGVSLKSIGEGNFPDVRPLVSLSCLTDCYVRLAILLNHADSNNQCRDHDARQNLLDIVIRIIDTRRGERSSFTSPTPSNSFAGYGEAVVNLFGKLIEEWIVDQEEPDEPAQYTPNLSA